MPTAVGIYYFAYEDKESIGPSIVLIHGAGGNHLIWPPELRRIPGHNVYAIDLPGHGKSEGVGEQSIDAYAERLQDWMQAVGIRRALLVGHSLGGAIAIYLALRDRYQVSGLCLASTGGQLKPPPGILDLLKSPVTFQTAIDQIIELSFSKNAEPKMVQLVTNRLAETRQSVIYGDFLAAESFNFTDKLGQIRQPTLVICGDQDKITPVRYSQLLENKINLARLTLIPDAGHLVMLEKPGVFLNLLTTFLHENRLSL